MKRTLIASIIAAGFIHSAAASVVYNDTITYINGSGNPNTDWVSDAENGILLGIRADNRTTGATPNNGAGVYNFLPGNVGTGSHARADWNYQFTINSDPANGSVKLNAYDYYLTLSVNGGPASAPVNVLTTFSDSTYGDNTSSQCHNVVIGTPATDGALGAAWNVAANSESITFLGDPNNGGIYRFDFYATAAGAGADGAKVDEVRMQVNVVPEPATIISGVMLLLPFGAGAMRKLRGGRAA